MHADYPFKEYLSRMRLHLLFATVQYQLFLQPCNYHGNILGSLELQEV